MNKEQEPLMQWTKKRNSKCNDSNERRTRTVNIKNKEQCNEQRNKHHYSMNT